MKLFKCQHCSEILHFENRQCLRCGHRLGYLPKSAALLAVEPDGEGGWCVLGQQGRYRFCANADYDACTWLLGVDEDGMYCLACRHNRTIADLSNDANRQNWLKVERAKHHLFYALLQLRLPLSTRAEEPDAGLAFDFLADFGVGTNHGQTVLTGHSDGVITLNLSEADDAFREQHRLEMGEPYRTLLGHLRHEIGHYYWSRLIQKTDHLQQFRTFFGDETADYQAALNRYYASGPIPRWQDNFVSAYATAHPWEDFAETWAHYLHIVDTLEMAGAFGLRVQPPEDGIASDSVSVAFDPYREGTIARLIDAWLPVTLAVNSLNRCMGQPDFYPFVLTPAVVDKLGFIHAIVRNTLTPREGASVSAGASC